MLDSRYNIMHKVIRYLLNFVLLYIALLSVVQDTQLLLIICMFSSMILYLLDFYFPICNIIMKQ